MLRVKFALRDGIVFPKGGIDRSVLARIPVLAARLRDDSLFAFKQDRVNKVDVKIEGVSKQDLIAYLRVLALRHKYETLYAELERTEVYACRCLIESDEEHTHTHKYFSPKDGDMLDDLHDRPNKITLTVGMVRLCEFFMDKKTLVWYQTRRHPNISVEAWGHMPDIDGTVNRYIDSITKYIYGYSKYDRTLRIVKNFVEDRPSLGRFIWESADNREIIVDILSVPTRKRKRFLSAEFEHLLPMATGEMQPGNGYLERLAAKEKTLQDPEYVGLKRRIMGESSRSRGWAIVGDWISGDDIEKHPDLVALEKRLIAKYMKN